MDQANKEIIEKIIEIRTEVRKLGIEIKLEKFREDWHKTGLNSYEKFFDFCSKQSMPIAVYLILALVILANIGIWL